MRSGKRIPWWVFAGVLLPFGLGGWAPAVPGFQRRRPVWVALAALSLAAFGIGIVLDPVTADGVTGLLILFAWVVSGTTVIAIRGPFLADEMLGWEADKAQAGARLHERRQAIALVASDPALAAELGVGRPDVPGARHAGVVDLNHAGAGAIAGLPGFDPVIAARVVTLREEVGGFASLADFGSVADLDGNTVERLRERAVFLPW